MTYPQELIDASKKYYKYACKLEKASGGTKRFLQQKVEEYEKKTFDLFRKYWIDNSQYGVYDK